MAEQDSVKTADPATNRMDTITRWSWLLFPTIVLMWGLYWALVVVTSDGWTVRGKFGDAFGGFNAVVSGLAFSGIIIAILLQRRDLELQRQQLELQREELRRSAEAQEQQAAALRLTAQLNARAALLSYYSAEIDLPFASGPVQRDLSRASEQADALESTLDSLRRVTGGE